MGLLIIKLIGVLFVLAFWAGVIYVGIHFAIKFW